MTAPVFATDLEAALAVHACRLGPFCGPLAYFEEVESTNDVAARLAAQGAPEGTVVAAGAQTAGRGRLGRAWFSPRGAGLYVSVVLRPTWGGEPDGQRGVALITLMAGAALAEATRHVTGLPIEIKWPNDLVIGRPRRKVAGILAEATVGTRAVDWVILGFGINVRDTPFPPALAGRATALERETGGSVDSARLVVEALAALAAGYDDLRSGRKQALLDRWRALSPASRGTEVEWQSAQGIRRGVTEGLGEDGALLVRVGPNLERLVAGEVTWLS
jgi:BirA family biotin operon repressor/biotin-[acetyl-CoA-carboxylase] ligase